MLAKALSENGLREALRLLLHAQTLLAEKEAWAQRAWARGADGQPVSPTDVSALAWCLGGAVLRAEWDLHGATLVSTLTETDMEVSIEGPKRLVNALKLLAPTMTWIYLQLQAEQERDDPTPAQVVAEDEEESAQEIVHPTLVASLVNDLPLTTHNDVMSGLQLTIKLTQHELQARRRTRRERTNKRHP